MTPDKVQYNDLLSRIDVLLHHNNLDDFDELARDIYHYQLEHNRIFNKWLELSSGEGRGDMPFTFLPISFYKNQRVVSGVFQEEAVFTSSGTSSDVPSRNYVRSLDFYKRHAEGIFEMTYGSVKDYCILALLPSYLERKGSSLITMVDHFIRVSQYEESGFYLYNHEELKEQLLANKKAGIPTVLFGVSFALLDFVEEFVVDFPDLIVIETGGMKGRREEIIRAELHHRISAGFGVSQVHSEYGMTELFSQAYSVKNGIFKPSSTMRVYTREIHDPFKKQIPGRVGVLNIIDLLNIDNCSFIATDDLGIVYDDGTFEVLGRLDHSERRGCSLLAI